MKKLATVAVAVVMTAVSGFSVAGDVHKAKAEMLTKSISGYKWSNEKISKSPYKNVSNTAAVGAFKWGKQDHAGKSTLAEKSGTEIQTAATSKVQGFKWGIRSNAEQQGFKWGIRSTAEQQGFKWGIRSNAEQQGFKWGIR
ncbi:MAG: hypothetical protein P8O79_12285 [Halieaceae bacterium]|nr:hypothetical protein [Halieaceae bacterium]